MPEDIRIGANIDLTEFGRPRKNQKGNYTFTKEIAKNVDSPPKE